MIDYKFNNIFLSRLQTLKTHCQQVSGHTHTHTEVISCTFMFLMFYTSFSFLAGFFSVECSKRKQDTKQEWSKNMRRKGESVEGGQVRNI